MPTMPLHCAPPDDAITQGPPSQCLYALFGAPRASRTFREGPSEGHQAAIQAIKRTNAKWGPVVN
eukprot:5128545-Amphidinium_carterae.1